MSTFDAHPGWRDPRKLRPELPPMPDRIKALRVARGYPVPWFVPWIDGEPEFRAGDPDKRRLAAEERRCWVCGDQILIGAPFAFVVGPMCVVNRISADPPSHRACAEWSIKACPFLSRPHAKRRPLEGGQSPGITIKRNPGVSVLWLTTTYELVWAGRGIGDFLFSMGDPAEPLQSFAEGRPATDEEIRRSFDSGMPNLRRVAAVEGTKARRQLKFMAQVARERLGIAEDSG